MAFKNVWIEMKIELKSQWNIKTMFINDINLLNASFYFENGKNKLPDKPEKQK